MDLAVATAFAWREKVQVKVRCTNCVCGKSEQRGLLVNHTQSKIFGRFVSGLCEMFDFSTHDAHERGSSSPKISNDRNDH